MSSAMVLAMALCLFSAVFLFGAVTPELAAPSFFFALILLLLWAAKLFFSDSVSFKKSPVHWPVLGFLVYAAIRCSTSAFAYEAQVEFLYICFYALIYFAAAANFHHSRDRNILLGSLMALALFESGYGMWQAMMKTNSVLFFSRPETYNGRGSGTYICPNHLAGFLEMVLAILAARILFQRSRKGTSDKKILLKLFMAYVAIMSLGGIFFTFSRGGYVAVLIGGLVLVVWSCWRLQFSWPKAGIILTLLLVLAVGLVSLPFLVNRFRDGLATEGASEGRMLIWNATMGMIQNAPIFGNDPGSWQWLHQLYRRGELQSHPVYAHSDILHLFSDYGLVGVLLVFAFFGCYFWNVSLLVRSKIPSERRSFAIGGAVGVIILLVHSSVDFNFHIPANALLVMTVIGFTAAMDEGSERFPRFRLSRAPRLALGTVLVFLAFFGAWKFSSLALSTHHLEKGKTAKTILQWEDALTEFQRALALDPTNPEIYFNIGDVYRAKCQWRFEASRLDERKELADQAIAYFNQSLALNPYQTLTLLQLARTYQILEDYDQALKILERAIAVDPENSMVYLRLGVHYRHLEQDDKATAAFLKAEALQPTGDPTSRLNLDETKPSW